MNDPRDEWRVDLDFFEDATPVWFHGNLDWDDMDLSPDLRADLTHPVRTNDMARIDALATRLAAELGPPFVVNVLNRDGRSWRHHRSDDTSTHPPAAAAFHRMVVEERANIDLAHQARNDPSLRPEWYILP